MASEIVESPSQPYLRKFLQYRLSTLLVLVTLVAIGLGTWRWWESNRQRRELVEAIQNCVMFEENEKRLFASLVWQSDADELREVLGIGFSDLPHLKRWQSNQFYIDPSFPIVLWQGEYVNSQGQPRRVYCLSSSWDDLPKRPDSPDVYVPGTTYFPKRYELLHGDLDPSELKSFTPIRSLIIVADDRDQLLSWTPVNWGRPFSSASLSSGDPTTLRVVFSTPEDKAPGVGRRAIDRTIDFQLSDEGVVPIGK